jgi:hypothetical protein
MRGLGPVPIPATVSAVIGGWESTDGARLRFTKDGWFGASDLPVDMTDGMRGPCADGGKWSIDQFDETQPPEVDLRLGLSPQCAVVSYFPLQMERVHSRLELYFCIGDRMATTCSSSQNSRVLTARPGTRAAGTGSP